VVIWGIEMGNKVRWALALAAAMVVSTCLSAPHAFAGEQYGGVAMMTATGEYLTGAAAVREYEALQRQPAINCGSCRKFVAISADKMPYIARNINNAFKTGRPFVLHRTENRAVIGANRKASCGGFQPNYGGWCDEYPFASSHEGGAGAATEEVPPREQQCQGGTLSRQYQAQQITEGVEFGVIVVDLMALPDGPYKGTDIARGQGTAC
jgi:hypothetical protein